jgi:uncharacterized protein (DUF433 family)
MFSPKEFPMTDKELLERITTHPKVMGGKPVIKGTRLTVESILELLAKGLTPDQIVNQYYGLSQDDVQACQLFAKK